MLVFCMRFVFWRYMVISLSVLQSARLDSSRKPTVNRNLDRAPTATAPRFSARFFTALLAGVEKTRRVMPQLARIGEEVAMLLLGGGRLFIASIRPDFVSEGFVRSGGLMLLEECGPGGAGPGVGDAVLLGWSNFDPEAERMLLSRLADSGAYVVGLGPMPAGEVAEELATSLEAFLESTPSQPTDVLSAFGGASYPLISLQNLVLLWTFTGEFVAALTRQGHMPTLYQSVLVPGARQRNERRGQRCFEAAHGVPPIAPGQLGGTYLDRLGDCLRTLVSRETEAVEQVARAGITALRKGRRIHAFLISHFPVHQWGAPGDPRLMRKLAQVHGETPSTAELEAELEAGDLFFFLGYYNRPSEAYALARQRRVTIAEIITGPPADDGPAPDLAIRPWWPYGDALVPVPNYDIAILPASGIVQTAIYWAVVGTMAI